MFELSRLVASGLVGALGAIALVNCSSAYGESEPTPDATDTTDARPGDVSTHDGDGAPLDLDAALVVDVDSEARPCNVSSTRFVFISSTPFVPDKGRNSADAKCQAEANAARLCGTFVAWLSITGSNALDRVADAPYDRVDGSRVVDTKAELAATGIKVAINQTATGVAPPSTKIWTGTKTSGLVDDTTCNDWSSVAGAATGTQGDVTGTGGGAGNWTDRGFVSCNMSAHVVCFQQ